MSEMTYEELRCALEVATENRRILAQAVLDMDADKINDDVPYVQYMDKYNRMLSLAEGMVK